MAESITFGFKAAEMIENGHVLESDLNLIKEWQFYNKSKVPKLTDEQISLFIIGSYNNIELCKKMILIHFKQKLAGPKIFNNRNILNENLQKLSNVVNFALMPLKYQNKSLYIVNLKDTNYQNFNGTDLLILGAMVLETLIYDNNPHELICILDSAGSTLRHLFKIKPNLALVYLDYVQHGFPLKIKTIHILNSNYIVHKSYNIIKNFISTSLASKFIFHSKDNSKDAFCENWIPKEYLPQEFGGSLESISLYHHNLMEKMKSLQTYFDAEERHRMNHTKKTDYKVINALQIKLLNSV